MLTHWYVELILIPLVGGAEFLDGIRGSCVPEGSLGSLFTEGQGCDPTWIVVWLATVSSGNQIYLSQYQ